MGWKRIQISYFFFDNGTGNTTHSARAEKYDLLVWRV